MKRRPQTAATERAGILAMAAACNRLDLIWRDLLQEDVGVDGTVEIVLDGTATGRLVGVQVKSGASYIRSETDTTFRFHPREQDIAYWKGLTIPLVLVIYDPRSETLYWVDVKNYIADTHTEWPDTTQLEVSKQSVVNDKFREYLLSMFDLTVYEDSRLREILDDLVENTFHDPSVQDSVTISALDIFICGLWGLCSKVQFHLSIVTESIRARIVKRGLPAHIHYNLSRSRLFPFLIRYFKTLSVNRLAELDLIDVNHSLYGKLEWPTFIAPLTVNGRRFVEFLRDELPSRRESIHDNQFFSLRLLPHSQIEVYASFDPESHPAFGPYTDVIILLFNRYLDYYQLLHMRRSSPGKPVKVIADQNVFYYELRDYLSLTLGEVPKDNVLCRHQDMIVSPIVCWLESFLDVRQEVPLDDLALKPPSDDRAFADELFSILAATGDLQAQEPVIPDLRFLRLANGELLLNEEGVSPYIGLKRKPDGAA